MFLLALVCVCLSVGLSVTTVTKKIVDGFVRNLCKRVPRGKGKTKFMFRYNR